MTNETKTERVNVSLRKGTIELIDRIWPKKKFRSRSAFLDEAARRYALRLQKASLKRQLRDGYRASSQENLSMLSEWEAASRELINAELESEINK